MRGERGSVLADRALWVEDFGDEILVERFRGSHNKSAQQCCPTENSILFHVNLPHLSPSSILPQYCQDAAQHTPTEAIMSETLVGINGFGRIGRIVFRNA